MDLVRISRELSSAIERLKFSPPITHVYNPLNYAWAPHAEYLTRYGQAPKRAIFLGMNPGPFGMVQTGIPFGDVTLVRDFLGIHEAVQKPALEHPKRPVLGFDCPRCEVSGSRLWGWVRDRFEKPERFFEHFFVVNYCPLAFLEESGRNFTPDKLPAIELKRVLTICDEALRKIVQLLEPEFVVGVGVFAEARARAALPDYKGRICTILHPSPASPKANRGWAEVVDRELHEAGVLPVKAAKPRERARER